MRDILIILVVAVIAACGTAAHVTQRIDQEKAFNALLTRAIRHDEICGRAMREALYVKHLEFCGDPPIDSSGLDDGVMTHEYDPFYETDGTTSA